MNTLFKWLIPIVSAAAVSTAVYFGVTSGSGAVETAPAATSPSSGSTASDAPAKPVVKKEITAWDVLDVKDSNTYSDDTVGKKYFHYLIDPFKNEDLWKQMFEVYREDAGKQNSFDSSFSDAVLQNAFDKDTSSDSSTYLNKVCRDAYILKLTDSKWNTNDDDNSNTNKLKQNVWKYCSLIEKEPKLIKDIENEDGYSDQTIGKEGKDNLVSVKDSSNDPFWKVKNKWFTALSPKPTEDVFKDKTDVKEACKAAYDKQANGAPSLDDVKKYCSFVEPDKPQQ